MSERIQIAFASGSDDLIPTLIERMRELAPGLPLWVVSEFPVEADRWIPYHVGRTVQQNVDKIRAELAGRRVEYGGLILQPRMPYWGMRLAAVRVSGWRSMFFNENLDHFMLRPRSAPVLLRHMSWRAKNWVRWEFRPGGTMYTWLWRLLHPWAFLRPAVYRAALVAGAVATAARSMSPVRPLKARLEDLPDGITVVIPSRNGRDLLDRMMEGVLRDLRDRPHEVIVSDNGSEDGTAEWLVTRHPGVIVEWHAEPLSFAAAVNRGIRRARYRRVCLLNNDMVIEPGFFDALGRAFRDVPDLFGSTAQIFFPKGQRREETGKAVMPSARKPDEFPVRCDVPLEGEDQTWVLYGSGGCTLYDTAKLRALGGLDEAFAPAYVEDLDLGYRAWLAGWPSVFVAGAQVTHHHRSTTSRYFQAGELQQMVERNYLRFVSRSVVSARAFRRLWRDAVVRLNVLAAGEKPPPWALPVMKRACVLALDSRYPVGLHDRLSEEAILALTSGDVWVFPGRLRRGRPVVAVASPYLPFPLSHGGAVRIYNLMKQASADYDQVLVAFVSEASVPAPELLELCAEIVLVLRPGSHERPLTERPDTVEEFDSEAYRAALRETLVKWRPFAVQLEFTQMAQYAQDCAGAKTLLVEHDVTVDLYRQLLDRGEDWETRQQYERWLHFEHAAWRKVDVVVTMSERDRRSVGDQAEVIANGVDACRFRPGIDNPEPRRLLFIGSFAHLPNVLAMDFFIREVWPQLDDLEPVLHVIAGNRPEYFLDRYRSIVDLDLKRERVEMEAFVADPRPAYRRAEVVIAPLVASAGTNIKIMEAMAMGKAVVSTPAGVNGLDLEWGTDVIVRDSAESTAVAIRELLMDAGGRGELEKRARQTAESRYDWAVIGKAQRRVYRGLQSGIANPDEDPDSLGPRGRLSPRHS